MRTAAATFLMIIAWHAASAPAPAIQPPAENLAAMPLLRAMVADLKQGNYDDAATKYEALAKDHLFDLAPTDESGWASIGTLLEQSVTPEHRTPLAAAYRKQFDAAAAAAVSALRDDRPARFERLYEASRRYPPSTAAKQACVDAADRALRAGDVAAALALYDLAKESGWTPDATREKAISAGREATTKAPDTYLGPLPHESMWYGDEDAIGLARYVPTSANGTTFFSGVRHVFAVNGNQTLWRFATPDAWTKQQSADRATGRGPNLSPVVFCSLDGTPQLLVVRQPRQGTLDYALRAFRASDGKTLWRTDADPIFANLCFAGQPTIAGSFLYAIAVEDGVQSMTLTLCALDLLDGKLIFRTTLGTVPGSRRAWENPRWWNGLWEQSEPTVKDRTVYVSPNSGAAFAVDRFTGAVRWMRVYEPKREDGPPTDKVALLRYRNSPAICGDVLVVAPQDTPEAMGLDGATGKVLWKSQTPPETTLVGGSGDLALFAGLAVVAIDARTGIPRWRYQPPSPLKIFGPPAAVGRRVYVPTSDFKTVCLDASTGKPASSPVKLPAVRAFLASEPGKRLLDEAGMSRAFAPPTP